MRSKLLMIWVIVVMAFSLSTAGTIRGFLRDAGSKEPLVMANVWLRDTSIGTATNLKGYFVLPGLSPGEYEVCFRYVGYKMTVIKQTIKGDEDVALEVFLTESPIVMDGAVVTAERDKRELDVKPSRIAVQVPQLRRIPQLAEPDLFRALQMMPGVATLSDFSAGLYIRGGSPDQNLILLDQIDVYNPNHMFGFFSTFNTDAIKSVELLKGGFPSVYGGRLSSVLNVINKEGNREKFGGVARVSFLSSSATFEGPWRKGSWMLSGRRTYLDLAGKIVDFNLPYYFYDGHAKVNYDIDRNNLLSFSGYLGNDILNYKQDGNALKLDWGNKTFSTQWTHLFSGNLFSHFVFAGSRFHSDTRVQFDKISFGIRNRITDLSLKGMLTYAPYVRHSMDFGFEAKDLDFTLDYLVVDSDYRNKFSGRYFGLYLQDNFKVTDLDILQAGLRFDHYSDGNYARLAPRLSFKHLLSDRLNLTLSYGQYYQYLNLVQQEGMSFADMWFPVDHTFKPGKSDHYILGCTYDNKRSFSIDLEGYYKAYDHIAEYRTFRAGDETLENQTAAQNFYSGAGRSYGLDVYLRNHVGRFQGWIGYSLGWTKKQVDGYNFDQEYYPTYDRRHCLTVIEDFYINSRLRLNVAFKYASGQPYTEATARYLVVDPAGRSYYDVLDGKKNFYRLPDYHRLDVGLFFTTRILNKAAEIFIQAVNVYDQDNVWYRQYQVYNNPATVKDYTQVPFVPTTGISIFF